MSQPLSEAGGAFGRVSLMAIDRPVGEHAHPQCHALFKVGGDDSQFEVDGRRYPLAEGTVVLVNAWQPHAYPFRARATGDARVLALYIEPSWLSGIESSFGAAARRDFFHASCVLVPPTTQSLVRAVAEELGGAGSRPEHAYALLRELMIDLVVRFSRHHDIPSWARSTAGSVGDHRIRRAMALIEERAASLVQLDEVAREVALSRPHFFELFRRGLGVTPNVYRNVVRMEGAYRALLSTTASIGEIGRSLGFSAHAHFTRFFRTNHGISPDAYRGAAWRLDG